jgi:hypothetical protein
LKDAIYQLCARGNARQAIFRDERDCARFLELLGESAQRFEEPSAALQPSEIFQSPFERFNGNVNSTI